MDFFLVIFSPWKMILAGCEKGIFEMYASETGRS